MVEDGKEIEVSSSSSLTSDSEEDSEDDKT